MESKMKNYIKVIVFISAFIFGNNVCFSVDCSPNSCDKNQRYPMEVCNPPSYDPPSIPRCLTYDEIDKSLLIASPVNLPVCLEFATSPDPNFGVYPPPQTVSVKGVQVFNINTAETDLQKAADRWNCICPEQSQGACQCKIKVYFTGRWCEYPYMNDNVLAATDLGIRGGASSCQLDCSETFIVVNNSDGFMYGKNNPPSGEQPTTFFITDGLIGNLNAVKSNGGEVYNFVDVMMHELGHLFGFAHYNEDDCGNASNYDEVMNSHGLPASGTSKELSDFEKCRFQAVYCPTAIYDYQPQTQKIYPNPGYNTVAFNFELPKYAESLKMSVMNPLAEVVLVPIENETFEQGEHSILINVDRLPNGVYYIIIEAGAYRTAQPLTIVR